MKSNAQEKEIVHEFQNMCEESIDPELYTMLVDKIIPDLKLSRYSLTEPSKEKPHCCFIDCSNRAEWQLVHGDSSDDYTEACTDHVGALLTEDALEIKIYPIQNI